MISNMQFAELPIAVYSAEWEDWPVIYQKYTQIVLMIAQEERTLFGFDLFECDLRTFSKVSPSFSH